MASDKVSTSDTSAQSREIWKPVIIDGVDYTGSYEVSNHGRVRSLPRSYERSYSNGSVRTMPVPGKMLSPQPVKDAGHSQVGLQKGAVQRKFLIHRLVAAAFLEDYDEGKQVHHLDHNPTNNYVGNLLVIPNGSHQSLHNLSQKVSAAVTKALIRHVDDISELADVESEVEEMVEVLLEQLGSS